MLLRFVLRRIATTLPMLLGIVFITFMLVRLTGRDPSVMLAGPMATQEAIDAIRTQLGLDQPIWTQFVYYVWDLLHGDLGISWQTRGPVVDEILHRLPATMELLLLSVLLGTLVGVPIGMRAATRPNGLFDQLTRVLSLTAFSIPTYWLGLMLIYVFYFLLDLSPAPMGRISLSIFPPRDVTGSYLLDGLIAGDLAVVRSALGHLALPVAIFSTIIAAPIMKQARAVAVEVINSDYVRYAHACGLNARQVRHVVLRNSLVPIMTFIGGELTAMLAAVSLLEFIFAWGGLGQWGLNAILNADFAAIQGYVLTLALFAVVVFFIVDLLVLLLEPRAGRDA